MPSVAPVTSTRRGRDSDNSDNKNRSRDRSRSRSLSLASRRSVPIISVKSHGSHQSSKKSSKTATSSKKTTKNTKTTSSAKSRKSSSKKSHKSTTTDKKIVLSAKSNNKKRGGLSTGPSISATTTAESESDIMSHLERMTTVDVCATNSLLEHSYELEGLTIKQLPWTHADTDQVKAQLRFLQEELLGGKSASSGNVKLWKEGMEDLENSIMETMAESVTANSSSSKHAVHSGSLSREDPLLRKLTSAMRSIDLVNVHKLSKLMKTNLQAGECVEGKDILLLCGETGAGKTTTMQLLLGTTFEEIEVDGFLHFGAIGYAHPDYADFRTSFTREPTTRSLQAAIVTIKGGTEEIAVCDAPSYDVANCLEEDIALGVGMVQALQRARSVRPVLVLSRDGMGNRFGNLVNSMKIMMRLFNVTEKDDWKPFQYVFTKYDEKHRTLLHKQFEALAKNPPKIGEGFLQDLFQAFIEDIAEKTSPVATVIHPIDDNPADVLAVLTENNNIVKANPVDLCAKFASEFSMKQLRLQMKIQLYEFRGRLLEEDYTSALKSIERIKDIANLFPEIHEYVHQAKEAFLQQVAQIWVLVVRSIGKQDYHTALYRMEQLSSMANDFPDATECSELGREMLSQSITEPIAEKTFDKAIQRMILLSDLQKRFPEASEALELGLQSLRETIVTMLEKKEYETTITIIKLLGTAEQDLCEAFTVAQYGLHLIRECLMSLIEAENYEDGMKLTMQVIELGRDFAEANGYVQKILKILRKRIDHSVKFGDYVKSGFLLRNLSQLGSRLQDGREYVEHALDAAAQHVCELRMEVVNAFEALLKVKDQKKYSQLLEYAFTSMTSLMKSEPMRVVCSEYYKTSQNLPRDDDSRKSNYLVILCTPRDCTSEAFCVAQVRHLVESISSDLSKFENENNTMEYLMANRKLLLSVLLRLRAANLVFQDGPGGSIAATLYEKAFAKFQALIEGILSMSEASFDSSMEMKEFEFQAWFLAFLIQGFTKDSFSADDRSGAIQTMDQLDHRRVTLMLRFENEISETMDLLSKYSFPEFTRTDGLPPDFVAYFQEVKLRDLEAPRQLLLSLSQAPQLCKMMATMMNAKEALEAVVSLDKSVVDLFRKIVEYMENAYGRVIQNLKEQRKYGSALRDAKIMYQTIKVTIRPEFTGIQNWSDDAMPGLEPRLLRLSEIEASLEKLIAKLQEKGGHEVDDDDISPIGFFFSLFSKAPLSCSCLGNDTEDLFLATLPVLSPFEPRLLIEPTNVEDQSVGFSSGRQRQTELTKSSRETGSANEASEISNLTKRKGLSRLPTNSTIGIDQSPSQGITSISRSPAQSNSGLDRAPTSIEPAVSSGMPEAPLNTSYVDDFEITLFP